ncbi:hypothetical protein OG21DRAFT_1449832 [Imleria badia]|nr:hypothetical protein OG21DRAFT_1449832 [Imleria badia]
MTKSSTMSVERRDPEINHDGRLSATAFSANGKYLVSGGEGGVRVWRVEDGAQMARMEAKSVQCLVVSKDGRWIAAGSELGDVSVWSAETYEEIFTHTDDNDNIFGVDFSPNSSRLVSASSAWRASVWDVATRKEVLTLRPEDEVWAAKFSPQGDQIATATRNSVQVYDSSDGRLLVDIPVKVTPWYNNGILWSTTHLFIVTHDRIKKIEAATGSAVLEWPVPKGNFSSCLALLQYGECIAYFAKRTVTFWDTSTHTQLSDIEHPQYIRSIALSPDDRFLAIGEEEGKIIIKQLSRITEPEIQIDDDTLNLWKHDQFADAEALLTTAVGESRNPSHHVLASRALVRSRLQHWDAAIVDAKESIKIQPSIIGYIARGVALVGWGKKHKHKAYRVCDLAFEHSHPNHVNFLLLVKAIIVFMAGEHDDAISRVYDLINTVHVNSICYVVQAYMHLLLGNSRMEDGDYKGAIQSFERARAQMRPHTSRALLVISLISGWSFHDLDITIRQRICEVLCAMGRIMEASECLLNIVSTVDEDMYTTRPVTTWVSDFLQQCLSTPESSGDSSLHSPSPAPLLRKWAKLKLSGGSWKDALIAALNFTAPRFTIYRALCDQLETLDRIAVATSCFYELMSELEGVKNLHAEQAEWVHDFRERISRKLECLGDAAVDFQHYNAAISEYSAALSLDLAAPQGLLVKRSRAFVASGLWEDALNDANKVIALDPSSPWGFERKHAALHMEGRYDEAIGTFETMLLKISQSSDPEIREFYREYSTPEETKAAIHAAIENTISESPLVLIDTDSGRLLDKSGQAASFELQPIFPELISSMTTHLDHARIEHEVAEYYRYATFSHKWEDNEPLFEKVVHIVVYDLEESLTHNKLRMFCKIVREAGYHWAWCDTCCINKGDHFVLQEALVSMFKWYEGSAVTIVLLRGVRSPTRRGDLVRSVWNTRAWTLQEYHASKVVRFYTEDWKLYMNLDIPNHKESSEIISEMEEATGVSARALMALRPGLEDIREKLRLASTRQTTRVEDAAYSLLGLFSMSLPVVYGEGDKALGRFLAQLLTSSGDTSILAWTGRSSSFNSCLPTKIAVFNQLPTMHIPPAIEGAETDKITISLRTSSPDAILVMKMYDRLNELPVPFFVGQRMKLPCIIFKLGPLSASRSTSGHVFRAQTTVLGTVEIATDQDLSHHRSLYLVHPWIDFLLDRQPVGSVVETIPEEITDDLSSSMGELSLVGSSSITSTDPQTRAAWLSGIRWPFGELRTTTTGYAASLRPPSLLSQADKEMRAPQVISRLMQPFGALLLTPDFGNVAAYRRVAAESLITVQVGEITPATLNKLVDSVRILDVL